MPVFYRRPGVYLEESLLVNPVDVAGTITVSAFVGATLKGPPNQPLLISSWTDFVTLFGGFDLIQPPTPGPANPDISEVAFAGMVTNVPPPANLTAIKADPEIGDNKYAGPAMTPGQYVTLGDASKASFQPPATATNRGSVSPGNQYAADPDITASDSTNAAKLTGEGFVAAGTNYTVTNKALTSNVAVLTIGTHAIQVGQSITVALSPADPVFDGTQTVTAIAGTTVSFAKTNANVTSTAAGGTVTGRPAWTGTQCFYIGNYAFAWNGTAWEDGAVGATAAPARPTGSWVAGPIAGTPAPPSKPPLALSYLPYAVYTFFQTGGRFTWVVRAVSSDSTLGGSAATISINGTDNTVSPLRAFDLEGISVGLWGNGLSYNLITQSSTPAGTPPVQDIFAIQVLLKNPQGVDEVVETFANMSMTGQVAGTRRVDAVINDPASGSRYIRVKNLNPAQMRPVQTGSAVPFTGGIDPGLPNSNDLKTAAGLLEKVEGPVNLNVSSVLTNASLLDTADAPGAMVGASIEPRAEFPDREDIVAFNDNCPPKIPNQSSAAYASTLRSGELVSGASSSYAASYAPWIIIPHPSQVGATIAIPPGGAAIGVCARIDATIGVQRAPAGIVAGISNAIGTQVKFTDTELGDLNASNINIIRPVIGAGICVMGARTRKGYGPDRYISARRVLISLKESLRRSTQYAVFENNDERLWSALRITADNILRPMWEQGGLRGTNQSEAYYIKCDGQLNTPAVIASGEVRMEIGVALEYPAEFVIIKITQMVSTQFTGEIQTIV